MLIPRDVIRFEGENPRTHRVVWADQRDVWLFDLDSPRTSFLRVSREAIEEQLRSRQVIILTAHGFNKVHVASTLTEKQLKRRAEMVDVVSPIVARAPEIFDDRLRGSVVADLERKKVRSAKTVHAALDRWWRGGMSLDTLVPDFRECGKAVPKEGARKVGVKQADGTPQGIPITPSIEDIFEKALGSYYSNDRKNALSGVYRMMRGRWFVDEFRDPATGELNYRVKPEYAETGFPTLRQFRYWYGKREDQLKIRRKRLGASNYEKDNRATTGSASQHLIGAGSRFEIDATKLEQAIIRSEIHADTYLDPPTFYQVTDVYTSLVCGIYVGHEQGSWIGAGLAMRNVVEDKVEFARRFGVTITHDQWPCQGVLPARLLADNAEFKGDLATEFTAKSHVTVENAEALRGDRKGSVEGKFTLFKTELRKVLPGLVKKNHANPGDADHRREAALTLKELTAAVIETVVYLNARKLEDFARKREMIEAGVFAIPNEMWRWAVRTGASELRSFDVATAEFAMLPTAKASVTKDGIRFKNLYYAGSDPRADAFARARQDGVSHVEISYDPLCTTNIYVHDSDPKAKTKYHVFKLTGASWEYRDISFEDASKLFAANARHSKLHQFQAAESEARLINAHVAISAKARKRRRGKLANADVAKGTKNSKQALREERDERSTSLPRTPGVKPQIVIDNTTLFAAQQRQREADAERDILGEEGMTAWLSGRTNDESA